MPFQNHSPLSSWLPRWLLAAAVWLCAVLPVHAHDPGLSTVEGRLRGEQLTLAFSFSAVDARQVWAATFGRNTAEAPLTDPRWRDVARGWCRVHAVDGELTPDDAQVSAIANHGVGFTLRYPRAGGEIIVSTQRLKDLPRNHREFAVITDEQERTIAQKFLTADDDEVRIDGMISGVSNRGVRAPHLQETGNRGVGAPHLQEEGESTGARVFVAFLRLGVEHIWTGYDHLLFLFGLLVICRSFRSIAAIISCFTVAHSLTLAAATLNLVHLPPQWVECAIAASIAFVGVENIVRRGAEPRGRALLTFAFGLIHGFGFATALRDLGVGTAGQSVVLPLFSFNLGVEAGQIAVAAVALPVIRALRRRDRFVRIGVPVLSSFVAVAGMFWFVERVAS